MSGIQILIPTYKPGEELLELLRSLKRQTILPEKIHIINTDQRLWKFAADVWEREFAEVMVTHIPAGTFDHGATRHMGMEAARSAYVVCMTQDALPADELLLEKLLAPMRNPEVAVSYARQLPAKNASAIEEFTRYYNYSDTSMLKGKKDIETLGIKTYMCSNVCAMYRKEVYDNLGGFIRHTIFNEDMIFAARAVEANYLIAYAADARVIHSHNYSGREQFHRNFDLGVSQADHPEIFLKVPSEGTGIQMVKKTAAYLCRIGKPWLLFRLVWISGCKYLGYRAGRNYRSLSRKKIERYTMNPQYWEKE